MDREIKLKGDKVIAQIPSIKDKAPYQFERKYIWDFAEIVPRNCKTFFRSGGSSGTIAKAMSAYDKDFSDDIRYRARRTLRN
jgi:hypothetical protein